VSVESPALEWVPGDPLYPHPRHRDSGDGIYVREFFQLLDEDNERVRWAIHMNDQQCACTECLVTWSPLAGNRCWVCEKVAHNWQVAERYVQETLKQRANMIVLRDGPWHSRLMEFPADRHELLVPEGTTAVAAYVEDNYVAAPDLAPTIKVHRYTRREFDWPTYKRWVFEHMGVV
jgi:hypothetical protein